MNDLKNYAVAAISQLHEIDASNVDEIRRAQSALVQYQDLCAWIEKQIAKGENAIKIAMFNEVRDNFSD